MFKSNVLIFFFFMTIFILSNAKTLKEADRHDNYKAYFDCIEDDKGEDEENKIITAQNCFDQSPRTKWKCCYFEYKVENDVRKGCMKVKKDDISDLNDLKDFVSNLATNAVFNCKQTYLSYTFIITISMILLLI